MSFSAALDQAYRNTRYRVFLPRACLELRVGERHPALDAWLESQGFSRWSLLTAWNPGSRLLPAEENRSRQARMEQALLARGFQPFPGENQAGNADWPPEASLLVPGMGRDEAGRLARDFDQNAFLAGERRGIAELLWIQPLFCNTFDLVNFPGHPVSK